MRIRSFFCSAFVLPVFAALCAACSSSDGADGRQPSPEPDGSTPDGSNGLEAGDSTSPGARIENRFITRVVSFQRGECAGFGEGQMPSIISGPPKGAGASQGGLDVVSLGLGGEIVVAFEPNAIVDGPGADFIVFENALYRNGDPNQPYAEPAEISVSDDGTTWKTYPCTAGTSGPYGSCAGWHAVFSHPDNAISPIDVANAGGDAFDLRDVGLTHARYVRIRDTKVRACIEGQNSGGFDLDAIAIVNAEIP